MPILADVGKAPIKLLLQVSRLNALFRVAGLLDLANVKISVIF